mgnify:CR=1 FL=1
MIVDESGASGFGEAGAKPWVACFVYAPAAAPNTRALGLAYSTNAGAKWTLFDGNPIVGYSKLKDSVRLLFWSGQSFTTPGLAVEGSFKAAEVRYTDVAQVKVTPLRRWLREARTIQWDYKNIVKRKGKLERLT